MALSLPPLTVYVHLPWCVAKCPYCDFNSHALTGNLPVDETVEALIRDLEHDLPRVYGRTVSAIFIGGGTPSLFPADAIERILQAISARLRLAPGAEVTMEANPGAVEHDRFAAYRAAGVNRISLGVQSFDEERLKLLGRIHGPGEAHGAIEAIRDAGFDTFNVDLMWAL
ncbi:MAG: coproporphyrinogen-III oxidase family protein, partial [Wenzhouxiangellaceae bacterium]|nr:coproporphyrinogen-III oxidase family protein [Wenzhouxiangellaceae bacterium]